LPDRLTQPGQLAEVRRLGWRRGPISGDSIDKRAAMSRVSALLYLSGGTLGLLSLLLPGDPGRNGSAIFAVALVAFATAGVPLVGFTRLPMWMYHPLTILGSVLISMGLLFGGTNAYVYGLLYFWIAIYASYFYSTPVTVLYLAVVGAEYAIVLLTRTSPGLSSVTWMITIGTLALTVALICLLTSRLAAVIHDLSASETAARASGERLRALIEAAPTAIVELDTDARVQTWNGAAERVFGWTADEVLGAPCPICPIPAAPEPEQPARHVEGVPIEAAVPRRNGEPVIVNLSMAPVFSHAGAETGAMMLATDMTDQKQLESQLHHARKMEAVGRLAGGIAHDFNNLLLVVRSYAWLLELSLAADDEARENLDEMEKAIERASNLTKQLLSFSQRQVGSVTVIDVNELISNMQGMLRPLIGESIALALDLDGAEATVRADGPKLEQVLINLAINARDAMPAGGELTLRTRARPAGERTFVPRDQGGEVQIVVTDTGIGIPTEERQLIFDPFFSTKRHAGGSGLGLSTVYGIIDAMGGQINVDSEVGIGTTFTIRLPRAAEAPTPQSADDSGAGPRSGTETLLLVEDEQAVREPLRRALATYGYTVMAASDGADAMLQIDGHPGAIDLLITDVVMPGLSGPDLVRRLSAIRPEMRVLYISGYVERSLELISPAAASPAPAGVTDGDRRTSRFLQKPFSPAQLAAAVRSILDAPPPHTVRSIAA
jgi:PAS domain S-box-containing protein